MHGGTLSTGNCVMSGVMWLFRYVKTDFANRGSPPFSSVKRALTDDCAEQQGQTERHLLVAPEGVGTGGEWGPQGDQRLAVRERAEGLFYLSVLGAF